MIDSFDNDPEAKVVSNENDAMSDVQPVNKPLFETGGKRQVSASEVQHDKQRLEQKLANRY